REHVVEGGVDGDAKSPAAQRARQRARDVHAVWTQDGARIGRPPEQVHAVDRPREHALAVGGEQRGRLEIAPGGQQTIGVGRARIGESKAAFADRRGAWRPHHNDLERRVRHPLSAPAVNPRMRGRCRNVNSTAPGSALRVTPAESWRPWTSHCPTRNRRPADSVRISVCDVNVIANSSSLHDDTNAKIAVAATPGAASGSTTRQSAPKRPQPSISADSSSSRGIDSKYPTSIPTVSGTVNEQLEWIRA